MVNCVSLLARHVQVLARDRSLTLNGTAVWRLDTISEVTLINNTPINQCNIYRICHHFNRYIKLIVLVLDLNRINATLEFDCILSRSKVWTQAGERKTCWISFFSEHIISYMHEYLKRENVIDLIWKFDTNVND